MTMNVDFSYEPVEVRLAPNVNWFQKMNLFLGHYDLRVYVADEAYVDIGRGSLAALWQLDYVADDSVGCVGNIGQFCDFAVSCKLIGGAEHHNDQPVNVVMTNVPPFSVAIRKHGIGSLRVRRSSPFNIGNAVVISANAMVLAEAEIDDGAVVGAGALATGKLEAFSIYGGVSAKKLKDRFGPDVKEKVASVRWWDFDTVYLGNNLGNLQVLAVDTEAPHRYRKRCPRLVLRILNHRSNNVQLKLVGFVDGDEQIPFTSAPANVQKYFSQLVKEGPYFWHPDIWNE